MKKLIILIIFTTSLLYGNELIKPFNDYQNNPTNKNFLTAREFYLQKIKSNEDAFTSRILLSYLYQNEINLNLNQIDSDSLNIGQKFQYANLLLSLNYYEDAISLYKEINQASPQWSCPYRHKGEALFKTKRYKEAEQAFLKAIETRKEHYDAYVWLAKVQVELKKYKEALETMETGISYKGKDIESPEKEIDSLDEKLLLLKLYKLNHSPKYDSLKKEIQTLSDNDPRLLEIEKL